LCARMWSASGVRVSRAESTRRRHELVRLSLRVKLLGHWPHVNLASDVLRSLEIRVVVSVPMIGRLREGEVSELVSETVYELEAGGMEIWSQW
jgi:hypothetical protein